MADKNIDIVVKVDASGAISAFDSLGNKLNTTIEKADAAASGFSRFQASLITINQAADLASRAFGAVTDAVEGFAEGIKRGADVNDVTEGFKNLSNQAGVLADTLLGQLREATLGTISDFDLQRKAIEALRSGIKPDEFVVLTKAAQRMADEVGGDLATQMELLSDAFKTGRTRALQNALGIIDLEAAQKKLADSLGKTTANLTAEEQVMASRTAIYEAAQNTIKRTGEAVADSGDSIHKFSATVSNALDQLWAKIAGDAGVTKALSDLSTAIQKIPFDEIAAGAGKVAGAIAGITNALIKVSSYIPNVAEGLAKLVSPGAYWGIKGGVSAVESIIGATESPTDAAIKEYDAVSESVKKADSSFANWGETLGKTAVKLAATAGGVAGVSRAIEELPILGPGNDKGMAEWSSQTARLREATAREQERLAQQMADDAQRSADTINDAWIHAALVGAQYLTNALVANFVGTPGTSQYKTRTQNSQIGGDVGSAGGAIVGAEIGGPVGAILGGQIGNMIGSVIGSMFGGSSEPGKMARQKADKWFADVFDANRLAIIVNGQLAEVKDLVFRGDTPFGGNSDFGNGSFGAFFSTLPGEAQAAFSAVGAAFEEELGVMGDMSGQLAAIIANNIGGDLENLQAFVFATGKSLEDLQKALLKALQNGRITFHEWAVESNKLNEVFQIGIEGVGQYETAFQHVLDAGAHGGRLTMDAIRDLAQEGKEAGLSMDQLAENLKKKFPESAKAIDAMFAAMKAGGESLDSLIKASDDKIGRYLAIFEEAAPKWQEASKSIDDIVTKIDKLDNKMVTTNIKLKVTTEMDANAAKVISAGGLDVPQGSGVAASV